MKQARFLISLLLFLSLSGAAEAAQRHRFDLPAGRLENSAIALGQQARINIGIRDSRLAGRWVGALRGTYSVKQALRHLLAGSDAKAVLLDTSTWLVVPDPQRTMRQRAAHLPALRVNSPNPTKVRVVEEVIAEIVVTGSKRRLRLGDYPGSFAVLDGGDEILTGVRGSEALVERVAALTSTHLGPGRNKLFLRGIADSSFNGPTQATVGQYFGETRLNYNAPDPDLRLYDVDKVEILPGPQGTLYGAGSLGGIIRIVPNPADPDRMGGSASLGLSATQHGSSGADGAAILNLPLAGGRLGLRMLGYAQTEGGYIDDSLRDLEDINRTRISGGRLSFRAVSDNGWTVDLGTAGQLIEGDDAQFADRDAPPLVRRGHVQQDFRNSYFLADLVVSKTWDDLRLVTATGLVRQTLRERYDSTRSGGTPQVFEQANEIVMFSADTRLSNEVSRGIGWIVGASFISNRSEQERKLGAPEAPVPITGVRNSIAEATLYGEATIIASEAFRFTAGARFAHSRLNGSALDLPVQLIPFLSGVRASRSETSLVPSFGLTAKASPELSFYLRYQQGFRPGGLAVRGNFIQRFRNDRVASVEAGLRYDGSGGFSAAASFGHTDWRDIQADTIELGGLPTTENIGDGRIWTADLALAWTPVRGLKTEIGAVLNESKVTNPVPSINITSTAPLPNVARVNARFGTEYQTSLSDDLGLRLVGSARYVGKSTLGIGPILGKEHGDWIDARLAAYLDKDRHSFSLTLSNLLDEKGNRFAFGSPFTMVERPQVTPLRPRTIRLGWETRF
ncbi:MAG: TonB-dependent receptor [Sphingosinicella sp.]|nr:TonB-dependent receptor [Sphingosinicella sp.]